MADLDIVSVSKRYGKVTALSGISLSVADGAAVTAGVRPERWRVDAEGPLTLAVDVIEPTGAETHVCGHVEGHAMRCVFRERLDVAPREILRLSVDPAALHAFDAETGRRVPA